MCDPITGALAAGGVVASLFGSNNNSTPAPPPAVKPPAQPQMAARTPNADVKIGDDFGLKQQTTAPGYNAFAETRTFGTPLGGLGRGGLGL